ncbi:hypothetical protein JTB14_026013 [Gonioctena quinquepunctata]|nr:hypothetical protein JTB14_026013 [Gonioctena quinquepunctata]
MATVLLSTIMFPLSGKLQWQAASPLISDMLTVNPKERAYKEKIFTHCWVNDEYSKNCLDISEELANQTPVRSDVLLSLAPPPPQLESEKLMLTVDGVDGG